MGGANSSSVIHPEEEVMANIAIGIYLAKNIFAVLAICASRAPMAWSIAVKACSSKVMEMMFWLMLPPV
jgi:hypothetical protein